MSIIFLIVTFVLTMAEGGYSKAELKRQIAKLNYDLYNIDLQIQSVVQGQHNPKTVSELQSAKLDIQKEVVVKEIELEKLNKERRQGEGGVSLVQYMCFAGGTTMKDKDGKERFCSIEQI